MLASPSAPSALASFLVLALVCTGASGCGPSGACPAYPHTLPSAALDAHREAREVTRVVRAEAQARLLERILPGLRPEELELVRAVERMCRDHGVPLVLASPSAGPDGPPGSVNIATE